MKITLLHEVRKQTSPRKGKTRPTTRSTIKEVEFRGSEFHCIESFVKYSWENQPINIKVIRIEG